MHTCRGRIAAALSALLWSTLLLPGADSAAAQNLAGRDIRIGTIVPSSGPFAEWGRTNTVTLKMLEQQINAADGVNGAKLQVFIYDDAAKPAQAANALRKLAGDDKVLAVAGPLTSSTCEVAFPIANQLNIVAMSQASSKARRRRREPAMGLPQHRRRGDFCKSVSAVF